jgi:hypothetical protein
MINLALKAACSAAVVHLTLAKRGLFSIHTCQLHSGCTKFRLHFPICLLVICLGNVHQGGYDMCIAIYHILKHIVGFNKYYFLILT